jgi:hypothetical protein
MGHAPVSPDSDETLCSRGNQEAFIGGNRTIGCQGAGVMGLKPGVGARRFLLATATNERDRPTVDREHQARVDAGEPIGKGSSESHVESTAMNDSQLEARGRIKISVPGTSALAEPLQAAQ